MKERKLIVLGVTGGIAAYKAADLCSKLAKKFDVQVIMTENACRFVAPLTFRTLSRRPVITTLWEDEAHWRPKHVELANEADLFAVVPATANFLAKAACGIADDALSTLAICMPPGKIMLAPAMNPAMWNNVFVQKNVGLLKEAGVNFCGPADGHVACGVGGSGRMEEPQTIFDAVEKYFGK